MGAAYRRFERALLACPLVLVLTMAHARGADVSAADIQQVRALFQRQAAAESAHDIEALDRVLAPAPAGQPDPVSFVARAYQFIGRDAVMAHFRQAFEGTWRVETDESAIRIVPLGADIAQIHAPSRVTLGAAGQPPRTAPFLIDEFAIRTPVGWRISAIVVLPAQ